MIYGCGNCLIRRSVFERVDAPAFDLRFNFLGGGDTDFFYRCLRLGMRFHWVAEATISETVPPSRTKLSWLITPRPADRRHQLSRPAQGDADGLAARQADAQIAGGVAAFASPRRACRIDRARADHRDASDDGGGRQRAGGDRHRTATLQGLEDHVSQFAITSQFRIVAGGIWRQQVLDVVRCAAFVGASGAGMDVAAAVRRSRRNTNRRSQHRQRGADLCGVRRPCGADDCARGA